MAERGGLDGSDRGALNRARQALSSEKAAALEGLTAATLMTSSIYLIERQPGVGTASRDLSWYGDSGNRFTVELGLEMGALGMVAFLWFMAVIRRRLADREDQFHATVFLGSGIAFVILATTAAVCAAAPTLVVHFGSEESLSDSTLALARPLVRALGDRCVQVRRRVHGCDVHPRPALRSTSDLARPYRIRAWCVARHHWRVCRSTRLSLSSLARIGKHYAALQPWGQIRPRGPVASSLALP
jgi:hypothetical protein